MSYGIKYRVQYKRRSGNLTTIDILENGYAGSITELQPDVTPLTINIEGDFNNIFQPTVGSGSIIRLLVSPLTLISLFTSDPQKYIVKCYNGNSGSNLFWQGFISTCIYNEDYSVGGNLLTPIIITCNDGMSILEDIPYMVSPTGSTYTGFAPVYEVMENIFSKLNISFSDIITSNDLKIADYSYNPFLYLTVNNENYIDEKGVAMSCRKVLDSIFGAIGLTMKFRGDVIYLVNPINLHTPSVAKTYSTSPVYGAYETSTTLGGYIDFSGGTIGYYETGQQMDIIQPFNEVIVKYDPYNFSSSGYDFNAEGNAENNNTYGTFNDDGTTYRVYVDVTMKDWTINGIHNFEGIQKIQTGSTTTEGNIDYYIKETVGASGTFEYTFPMSNIKQDENLRLELSADFYINTKHYSNLWSTAAGTLVNEVKLPVYIMVGNQWYGGGNSWTTGITNTYITVRTPDTRMIQKYERHGWWLWRHTDVVNIDDSQINDTWTTASLIVDMGQSSLENLINGSIKVYIPAGLNFQSVTPSSAEAEIQNVLIKNINISSVKTDYTEVGNNAIETKATLYNNSIVKKATLDITLTNGCGNYGCSRSSFSTDQQPIQGTNITGMIRTSESTKYDTAKLLAQDLISQYKQPRTKITANLDVTNYGLALEHILITDNRYLSGKGFNIITGNYIDDTESMNVEMLEITSERETIN